MHNVAPPLSFNPAGIELDRRQGLSRQLYQALRARVLDGRLASGTRLPASRDLAAVQLDACGVERQWRRGVVHGSPHEWTYRIGRKWLLQQTNSLPRICLLYTSPSPRDS